MKLRILLLLFIGVIASCSDNQRDHLHEKYYGIYIDHDMRRGSPYSDPAGTEFMYFYVKAVITNDSIIPAHVSISIPEGYYRPTPPNGRQFKVFLLPDSILPGDQWTGDGEMTVELKNILDNNPDNPVSINKIVQPGGECAINIGLITELKYELNPYMSLFSKGHKFHPWPSEAKLTPFDLSDSVLSIPDSAMRKSLTSGPQLSLSLGICFYNIDPFHPRKDSINPYCIIPCGQISFSR